LAAAEKRHAAHWAAKLTALGERVAEPGRPTLRTRLLSWLARRLSVDTVLPLVERAPPGTASRTTATEPLTRQCSTSGLRNSRCS
jgi:hypothetical protein